jgi:high affinity sulfate transporter 1
MSYQREWLSSDLIAGLSVAAVALPIGIAYADLAGFSPEVGIYSAILPPIAYALFGTSRQLIVNPDSACCAIVAATLAPLAMPGTERYADLSIVLALLVGVFCVIGGFARLGVLASFLSRPILTGYMNGIALSIIAGQLESLLGYRVEADGFFRKLFALAARLGETHVPTVTLGLALFALVLLLKRIAPRVPAPLVAAVLGIGAVAVLGLDEAGVAVVGAVPAGLPVPRVPNVSTEDVVNLLFAAGGMTLLAYCSMIPTARGFAAKNGYRVDPNREFTALGAANIAAALARGFVVSGADSRTAVGDAAGGKSQLTGIVAAAAMTVVLLFFTAPLALLPRAALAAIVISAVLGLFDFASLRRYYRTARLECWLSLVTTLGVLVLGLLPGILIAVGLAIIKLLQLASRPHDAVLGVVHIEGSSHATDGPEGERVPGLLIYRFDGPVLFFNADYFADRARLAIAAEKTKPRWFLLDAEASIVLDTTGADMLEALRAELERDGVVLAIARAKGLFSAVLERSGLAEKIGRERLFSTVRAGVAAFVASTSAK